MNKTELFIIETQDEAFAKAVRKLCDEAGKRPLTRWSHGSCYASNGVSLHDTLLDVLMKMNEQTNGKVV